MKNKHISRRQFIKKSAVAAATLSLGSLSLQAGSQNGIPYRLLGRTNEKVSLLSLGGYNIGITENLSEAESIKLMRTAIEEGINFFDNAWDYHNGLSEERMGKALQDGYRDKVLLMTKHHGREPEKAKKHLEESLRRLRSDMIDVWQFHEIDEEIEIQSIYSSGVLDFAQKAKEEGKIRYIGFTGHYRPGLHMDMINRGFNWDTVQMPINLLDHHFESFTQNVLPLAVEKNIAVIAMKTMAGTPGVIVREKIATAAECLRFAMSMPVSTVCSGMDSLDVLQKNVKIAREFKMMSEQEIAKLLTRTTPSGAGGKFEGYKTYATDNLIE